MCSVLENTWQRTVVLLVNWDIADLCPSQPLTSLGGGGVGISMERRERGQWY